MKIRIFHKNELTEYDTGKKTFVTVGSSSEDTVCVTGAGLLPAHVTFELRGGVWSMHAEGKVRAHENPASHIKNMILTGNETFALSRSNRTVLTVFEPGEEKEIDLLSAQYPITFGRSKDNLISVAGFPQSRHHLSITRKKGEYYVADNRSTVGTFVNGIRIRDKAVITDGSIIVAGNVTFTFRGSKLYLEATKNTPCEIHYGPAGIKTSSKDGVLVEEETYELFHRSLRKQDVIEPVEIDIDSPPSVGGRPEINWLSTLLPAIIMIIIALAMAASMPTMLVFSLPMTIGGVLVSIINYRTQTKKFSEREKKRSEKYTEHLVQTVDEIEKIQKKQLKLMNASDPDTEHCTAADKENLWNRSPGDRDFCSVRIGSGPAKSAAVIKVPKKTVSIEDDELRDRPEKIKKKYKYVKNAPITCSILDNNICGIVGRHEDAVLLLRNMLVQLASHHSYSEMNIICIYDKKDSNTLGFVRDLPHAMDERRKTSFTADSKAEASELLTAFADMLKRRRHELESDNSYGEGSLFMPFCVFTVAQPSFFRKDNPINDYLLRRQDLGAGLIMLAENIHSLPKECSLIIEVEGNTGKVYPKDHAGHMQKFKVDRVSQQKVDAFGKALRYIKCEEPGSRIVLPEEYSFFDMQGIEDVREWDLSSSWRQTDIDTRLSAPLGIRENGRILSLDLIEDGPHGLVAGTTGSGKSRAMISYILSLALRYPPSDLNFMIIDFKGGAMITLLEGLPHLAGTITNIDEGEINRSLSSIRAELNRRQRIFKDAETDDISEYIRLFRSGKTEKAVSHLVIIVDEFGELKSAHPDFMKELISTARIGRSLGVHLILSTQTPETQVSEEIWSNSNFQICFQVADEKNSSAVIKSKLAASIEEPGRGYLHVTSSGLLELFQSGYIEAMSGNKCQYKAVIEQLSAYCSGAGIEPASEIILPALPASVAAPQPMPAVGEKRMLTVGVLDDVDNQCRRDITLDLMQQNYFVMGSAMSGKTGTLQAVVKGIADNFTPEEFSVYIIDFASGILKNFEDLPHVGGVVTVHDDEKLKNLFKLLGEEIEKRRNRFIETGVSSFASYLETGRTDMPQILLIVDNLTELRGDYFEDEDLLLPVCREGLSCGISVMAANTQITNLSYKYLSCFSGRISMYCNDRSEYAALFDRYVRILIPAVPGRCIVQNGREIYEGQIYRAFPGEKEYECVQNVRKWIDGQEKKHLSRAALIPEIPEVLTEDAMLRNCEDVPDGKAVFAAGLDYETVEPAVIDLDQAGLIGISGNDKTDSRYMMRWLVRYAEEILADSVSIRICDSIYRGMSYLADSPVVDTYEYLPDNIKKIMIDTEQELADREAGLINGDTDIDAMKLLVIVIAGNTTMETICSDIAAMAAYKNMTGRYKALRICIILSECENETIGFSSPEILKEMKEKRNLIYIGNFDSLKIVDKFGVSKDIIKKFGHGDAYLFTSNDCRRIKIPSHGPEH